MELTGKPALVLIDIQKGEVLDRDHGVPTMPGSERRHERSREVLAAARASGVPPIFVQEVHKRSLVDFGRELDGEEGIHCLEGDLATELADGFEPAADEYLIRKRRYSAFFATELELVLKALGVDTLVLLGTLTDVCVHYTFADAHQHDYRCKVVADCVGGSSPAAHGAALEAMRYLQRDCIVSSGEILAALDERAAAGVAAGAGVDVGVGA